MKRKLTRMAVVFLSALLIACAGYAQQATKAVDLVKKAFTENKVFGKTITSKAVLPATLGKAVLQQVNGYNAFEWNREKLDALGADGTVELVLPLKGNATVTLQLVESNFFTNDYLLVTSDGKKMTNPAGRFYQGIVKGDESSLAAISFFDDEVGGFFTLGGSNYVVGKLKNAGVKGMNIVYQESDLASKNSFSCLTPDTGIPEPVSGGGGTNLLTNRCVRMYFETEVDFFTAFGNNSTSVSNYVTNLFNQVRTLYNNDGISVALSQIFVWTTTDPYTSTNVPGTLSQFQSTRTSFNGDLGQLLTTRGIGGGQAAGFAGICNPTISQRLCVSGNLTTSFPNVPTFSWEVYVTSHEFGHLFGSRHTHACVWNGNNTAIDGCSGFVEGSCALPPTPAGGGTIMSYCHLNVGVNFSLGFGPQPAQLIRNNVEAGSCLGSCVTTCAAPGGLAASSITSSSATLSWAAVSGAANYTVEYKAASSGTWIVAGTVSTTSFNLTGLAASTVYDWRVKANCSTGYGQAQFTTTPPSPCATPVNLSSFGDCFYADLFWDAVPGASTYRVEYKRSTSTTWLLAEAATPFNSSFISTSTGGLYNWRVQATCPGGISSWAESTVRIFAGRACLEPLRTASKTTIGKSGSGKLKVTPQPAKNEMTISYQSDDNSPVNISLINQLGSVVVKNNTAVLKGANTIRLNVSNVPAGTYVLRLNMKGKTETARVVIE
jgi:Metallo-peptidase family M12/Secretion system C-terminal sorting domain/Fibronectin type III domain